jgi:phosphoribosylanthranilate isomerase
MISVKICGVTTPEDALAAREAGADMIGLNFSSQSVRKIDMAVAETISADTLKGYYGLTGLFVEQSWEEIARINRHLKLGFCQFYNHPWPKEQFTPAGLVPAFRVKDATDLDTIRSMISSGRKPAMIVVDSYVAGAMGGTGHKAPWDLLVGQDFGVPLILAGGLTPENVAEAIRTVRPWGVDVASGVESSPGRKCPRKMEAFVQAARRA